MMMRTWLSLLCAAALAAGAAAAPAAEKDTGGRKATVSPSVTRDMKGYVKLRGTIESVELRGRKLSIRSLEGKLIPLKAGKHVNLDNFQEGDAVKVDAKDGVAIIVTIDSSRQKTSRPKTNFRGH
jgi:hypothetical protein